MTYQMTYRVQRFAELSGVTVRTLHHYDRLGLLKPAQRSEGGYRLYSRGDLLRLERITVLRYLGLSLRQIGKIVSRSAGEELDVAGLLRTQAVILRERRDGLTRVLRAVEAAEQVLEANGRAASGDWQLFQTILEEVSMQENSEWSKKYYNEAAQQAVETRKGEWSPELQEKVTAQWKEMFAKVEAALAAGVEPASEEGRAIAAEWSALVGQFTRGNREVAKGLNSMYADQGNWPAAQSQYAIKPELLEFIRRAVVPEAPASPL